MSEPMRDEHGTPEVAPSWVASVPLAAIAEQRATGWADFHPEHFCHRCGGRNLNSWVAPPEDWALIADEPDMPGSHIICPSCFTVLLQRVTGAWRTWTLTAEDPAQPGRPCNVEAAEVPA